MKTLMERFGKILKENFWFAVILLFYICYYTYRLFAITPWYDEQWTYINMIDKGFIYSATHWPLPNNHVFFSMLSSFFKIFGVYIGLRGVSWLAAIGTLILLYLVLKNLFSKGIALFGIYLYGFFPLVNSYAVQGRGYSLATFFLILAIYCGLQISYKKDKRRYYVLFATALYLALYTLMSSIYWVLPVCVCFGVLLLLLKKYKQLIRLIVSSVAAALFTVFSYGVLWAFMGAQSIKAELPLFQSELAIIFEYPRSCVVRGIQIMSSDRNLQSIAREVFFRDFKYFFRGILAEFTVYYHISMFFVFALIVIGILLLGIGMVVRCKRKGQDLERQCSLFAYILSSIGFITMYLILVVQSVYPFNRVFSFLGVFLTIMVCLFLKWLIQPVNRILKPGKRFLRYISLINIPVMIWYVWCMLGIRHNQEYSSIDYYAYDAVKHVQWEENDSYAVNDIFSRQQIIYHLQLGDGISLDEVGEKPDFAIIYKAENRGQWPFVISEEEIRNVISDDMSLIYENQLYEVYQRD